MRANCDHTGICCAHNSLEVAIACSSTTTGASRGPTSCHEVMSDMPARETDAGVPVRQRLVVLNFEARAGGRSVRDEPVANLFGAVAGFVHVLSCVARQLFVVIRAEQAQELTIERLV